VLPPASSRAIAGTGARSPSPPPPPSSRAVEAGELAWDEPLAARLGPLLPRASASRWHPQWRGLTLLHLLSHRSGFARLDNDPEMDAFPPEEADPRASRLALTGLTLARPPEAPPGARFIYSNRNYIVAAAMLEAATGRPWEDLMRERLFAPLAMEGAGFGPPELFPALPDPTKPIRAHRRRFPAPAGRPRLVAGPARRPPSPGVPPQDNPAVAGPAARLHAPMAAMIRFLEAHRTRAPLLRPATWDRLHTPPFGGTYALGWVVRGDGSLWHDGSNNLWTAQVRITGSGSRALATNWGDHAAGRPARNRARQLKHPPRLRLPAALARGPGA
jgi:CubicO group peptidase (beta-lactamase class C family)